MGLALDNNGRHLAAESVEENNGPGGINIVDDNNKESLLDLDESNTVVEAVLKAERLLRILLNE